jgi:hypothetical protein
MNRAELVAVIRSSRKAYCTVAKHRTESRYLSIQADIMGNQVADLVEVLHSHDSAYAQAKMDHEEGNYNTNR